ncbi:hypothetical protein BDM02DRAFT_3127056 [Thelephora ganbajun]|uniref:Uncharacterized protein n=1 Tax=Thelephora ganbajun TaxID=370292 RepID=A0ACB6ZPG5_THEGA|nr:hypothetical protein BDM02DRAFT_3127056 [Thelephora ganbajun]
MTLENNCTFISPHHQKISHVDMRPHRKDGKGSDNAYSFEYPTMASLIDAVISQEDNEFPCFWQQAIRALKNQDHTHQGQDIVNNKSVLFNLLQAGLIDHEAFDQPHNLGLVQIKPRPQPINQNKDIPSSGTV